MLPHFENMLKEADDQLFLHGACHIFALALSHSFGYSLRVVHDTTARAPKGAVHVFCQFDDFDGSRGVDVLGVFDECQRLFDKEWLPPRYTVLDCDESTLQGFTTQTSGGGLYIDEKFVSRAHARASCIIEKYFDYYSGHYPTLIPEFRRTQKVDLRNIFDRINNHNSA